MEHCNILLIDDNIAEVIIAKEYCRKDNIICHIDSVKSGKDALYYLEQAESKDVKPLPDFIFLDLNMPDMDGKTLLNLIKTNPSFKHIPVIIYSGSDRPEDQKQTEELGANYYMIKPIRLNKLQHMLSIVTSFYLNVHNQKFYLQRT